MPIVAITRDDDIAAAIGESLSYVDLAGLVSGRLVAIKPNDTWASEQDKSAFTQGHTLRAVLRHIKQLRPREIVVTGGAGAAETENVFRLSGMMEVIREENVAFFDHNRPPFTAVELEYGPDKDVSGPRRSVMVNPRVLEYEILIAVSQLKVHRTATVTPALKNTALSYPAADYYGHPRSKQKHEHHFYDCIRSLRRWPSGFRFIWPLQLDTRRWWGGSNRRVCRENRVGHREHGCVGRGLVGGSRRGPYGVSRIEPE